MVGATKIVFERKETETKKIKTATNTMQPPAGEALEGQFSSAKSAFQSLKVHVL